MLRAAASAAGSAGALQPRGQLHSSQVRLRMPSCPAWRTNRAGPWHRAKRVPTGSAGSGERSTTAAPTLTGCVCLQDDRREAMQDGPGARESLQNFFPKPYLQVPDEENSEHSVDVSVAETDDEVNLRESFQNLERTNTALFEALKKKTEELEAVRSNQESVDDAEEDAAGETARRLAEDLARAKSRIASLERQLTVPSPS